MSGFFSEVMDISAHGRGCLPDPLPSHDPAELRDRATRLAIKALKDPATAATAPDQVWVTDFTSS